MTIETTASVPATGSALQTPTSVRWQPLRLGIVDLFYYEDEEFPFVDGRLLLRGNNGAGKSKVLALTLPLLFDGDLSPQRVEPDGDRQKRMEWNLLLGDEHPNNERVGYSWLEFGRLDENGEQHFTTIGLGLKAARGRAITKHWFFVTEQRVGEQLQLIDKGRLVLGRDRLASALEGSGRVYDSKGEYRHAVDQRLFGLGERRYAELIELLLQIRAPQLSKKPSEAALSEALTRALTPVGDDVIKAVADGLRSLDEERDEVKQLVADQKAVRAFLDHYREYAKVMLKRQAEPPRAHQSEYERYGRDIIQATAELDRLNEQLADLGTQLAVLRQERVELSGEREALRDSENAESERLLEMAVTAAQEADERADFASDAKKRAEDRLNVAREEADADHDRTDQARRRAHDATRAADQAGVAAGVTRRHDELLQVPAEQLAEAIEEDRAATSAEIGRMREALERVKALLEAVAGAEAAVAQSALREAEAETRRSDAMEERVVADAAVDEAVDSYLSEVEITLAALTELSISAAAFEELADWVRIRTGENPAVRALRASADEVMDDLRAQRASAEIQVEELVRRCDELQTEIEALESGESVEPEVPSMHRAAPAESIPLWRAVSFRNEVDDAARAGLEAALEASGFLTAALVSDGSVRSAEDGQLLLLATGAPAPGAPGRTLADVLIAEPPTGCPVTEPTITMVLRSIALSEGPDADPAPVWVGTSGRYRLGAAYGAWSTETARFIGETARSAARERRLAEARLERDRLLAERSAVEEILAAIAGRAATVERERAAIPYPQALQDADRAAHAAAEQVRRCEVQLTAAREAVRVAADRARSAAEELRLDAEVLGLPADAQSIRALDGALSVYERRAETAWNDLDRLATAERESVRSAERREQAQQDAARASEAKESADTDLIAKRSHADALRMSVGSDVELHRQRVAENAHRIKKVEGELSRLDREERGFSDARIRLSERLDGLRGDQERSNTARVAAVEGLRRTTALGLARVAELAAEEPEGAEWPVTSGVLFARALDAELANVDASVERYNRLLSQVHTEFTELQRSLGRHGDEAAYIPTDDGVRVVVTVSGKEMLLVDRAAQLGERIEEHERLLNSKEREIIQTHLVAEVGAQLSELIGEADQQSVELNKELRNRPTSTGMILRVLWRPRADGPAGLAEARRILGTTADVWSEEDRTVLGAFLQARIAEVRDADEGGNWYDHLGEALDYRRWHRFAVERQQGGKWKPATGPASGGERVLAASIPLFAAASSHYRTAANRHAPRLIMLDEAFAGVDDSARADCLGLLAEFDLDVVMTSEREWGCYPEVPGLSIAQLTRFDGANAVHVQRWRWDGRQRTQAAERVSIGEPAGAAGELW